MIKTARNARLTALAGSVAAIALLSAAPVSASAQQTAIAISSQPVATALRELAQKTGVNVLFAPDAVAGLQARAVNGEMTPEEAARRLVAGTSLQVVRDESGALVVRQGEAIRTILREPTAPPVRLAAAAATSSAGIESVVVTSSKIKGDIQTVPIAITALSQEQLTSRQIAGGPDLVKEVPNLTFSKTNFSGYNLEIRGIGTQAVSVATDPAVAVAFNDTPFIRNHFFEQEFYDVNQVEVLRGPQGTLFGRNANAGVVNVVSAKPVDNFEAMLSADWGNYTNRRYEGMINIPILDDKLMLRVAGEWTKRDGYVHNQTTNSQTDGRDLWSSRVTLRWQPAGNFHTDFIWEHFQEDDDRLRSGKQLCKTDPGPSTLNNINGVAIQIPPPAGTVFGLSAANFSQGCLPTSLYSKDAFEVPNGYALPYVSALAFFNYFTGQDPYASATQSTNLRDIQSQLDPRYKANNDTLEVNAEWNVTPSLTFYSDTGYNRDYLWSLEDFNRFDTAPGIFKYLPGSSPAFMTPDPGIPGAAIVCDPQLGCSDRLVVEDLSAETAWQLSQEFRLASSFEGPLNFSAGGNYLHYETDERFYVFSNAFTAFSADPATFVPGVSDNLDRFLNGRGYSPQSFFGQLLGSRYIDPNPLTSLNDQGHNYFLSKNPYVLNSYALFGEAYYDIAKDLKLTAGLRWTDDQKHFVDYPSELLALNYGYPSTGIVDQQWKKFTGRAVANWTPKLDFTDQTMMYASFAHGYKAGGANPPGAILLTYGISGSTTNINGTNFPVHPLTFKPEYINAFELGTKNTAMDGAVVFDADVFYYDYTGYQISQIVDRTSINFNVNATVRGAEIQTTWEPLQGLKFGFNGGYEDTRINDNQYFIDLMDRTAGHPGWVLMRPWAGQASNCIFPEYVAEAIVQEYVNAGEGNQGPMACGIAYYGGHDPITELPYSATTYPITIAAQSAGVFNAPAISYPGYDPLSVDPSLTSGQLAAVNNGLGLPPNNGEGFAKNIGGNTLPNAPHFTASLTGDYSMPVSANWVATLHSDFYWQSQSWARIFNDRPYDKIRGYSNVNLALILNDASGWQIMGYVKNIFDTTAVTGDFLYSDDTGLTTNIFLTDPRLYGVRITKQFNGDTAEDSGLDIFGSTDGKRPQLWLQIGGNYAMQSAGTDPYVPPWQSVVPDGLPLPSTLEKPSGASFDWEGKLTFQPEDSDWLFNAAVRYGRSSRHNEAHASLPTETRTFISNPLFGVTLPCSAIGSAHCSVASYTEFMDAHIGESEKHSILDFTVGKEFGIGVFGTQSEGDLAAGVRLAQFRSHASALFNSDPHYNFPNNFAAKYHDVYNGTTQENRGFHGVGPEVTWDANTPVWGETDSGQVTFDWGVTAAVLFGRRTAQVEHTEYHNHCIRPPFGSAYCYAVYTTRTEAYPARTKRVAVPNLGGYLGASVRYSNAMISFGYRADMFFGAMDGGQATAKDENRAFYGPYLNFSIGLGG